MKLGELLDQLFRLSREQRTYFAAMLYYAPSEVSKFISGKRLPPLTRAQGFIDESAAFFADAFWMRDAGDSLREIFPIMRIIQNRNTLETFLRQALHNAYAESMEVDKSGLSVACLNHVFVQGKQRIFNHVLLTLSEAMRTQQQVRVLMTLSFFLEYMREECMPIRGMEERNRVHITVIVDQHNTSELIDLAQFALMIERWYSYDQAIIVDAVMGEAFPPHPFFFVERQSLLTINEIIPEAPFGAMIEDSEYLLKFGMQYSHYFNQRISFRSADIARLISQGMDIASMFEQTEAIYIFDSIGVSLSAHQIDLVACPEGLKRLLVEIMRILLKKPIPTVISWKSISRFLADRRVWVPFAGQTRLDWHEMVHYVESFKRWFSSGERAGTTRFTQQDHQLGIIVMLKDHVMLLTSPGNGHDEMVFVFPKSVCPKAVEGLKQLHDLAAYPIDAGTLDEYFKNSIGSGEKEALPKRQTGRAKT